MTIRRRLALSFLAILVLFAVNQAVYFWGAHRLTSSRETLVRALHRQVIIASLRQELDNLHKQVTLLSEIQFEEGAEGGSPESQQLFQQKLDDVAGQIQRLKGLTEPSNRATVGELEETYRKLADSWMSFHDYLGVEQTWALAHVIRADPLSQHLLTELVPRMQREEDQRAGEAQTNLKAAARRTDQMIVAIFAISTVVAVTVAYLVSRHLARGLAELTQGAHLIGGMNLEHRIALRGRDELGNLAQAFNEMAGKLLQGRTQLKQANLELGRRHQEVEKQRQVSESLLLNILPAQVAEELETQGKVEPRYFEDVTILFTDFVGFTLSTEKVAAEDLVRTLHDYFTAFDQIVTRYGLEKLKTIGDSYMCVGGLPTHNPAHPVDAVMAAFEMLRAVADRDRPENAVSWALRIGIHTGSVIAGVVGIKKFAFDIWGDSVNYASRMESSGAPNRINLSAPTHRRIKDFFECEHRGKIRTREQKEFDMYFANGILPDLLADTTQMPPPLFLRRYRTYFHSDPPAFPAFLLEPLVAHSAIRTSPNRLAANQTG